ncbi:universal stress protein [Streptomyces sp. NPDC020192]|uniref:universal stress protein n=1 Tax=Streptomyces sp. NPDC020192 TaxID=3365066 RepID=UPI003787C623
MSRVIVACADGAYRSRTAVEWAAYEASLRDLPLGMVYGAPPDDLSTVAMLVLGLSTAEEDPAGQALGPTAYALAAAAACPVVLVPDDPVPSAVPVRRTSQVTLGVDARHPAEQTVDFAFAAAHARNVRLHAVHAWELPSCAAELPFGIPEEDRGSWEDHEVQLLADALRPWRAKYPRVPVLEDVALLSPVEALVHHAQGAALVVVGHGSGGGVGLAQALLREARCPVAIVP